MPPDQLAVAIFPHLIPAAAIPNGELERALTEPLAEQRDEVISVICSHRRVVLGPDQPDGGYAAVIASGHLARAILGLLALVGIRTSRAVEGTASITRTAHSSPCGIETAKHRGRDQTLYFGSH